MDGQACTATRIPVGAKRATDIIIENSFYGYMFNTKLDVCITMNKK